MLFPHVAFEIQLSCPQDGWAFEVGETLYVNRIVRLIEYTSVFNYYKPVISGWILVIILFPSYVLHRILENSFSSLWYSSTDILDAQSRNKLFILEIVLQNVGYFYANLSNINQLQRMYNDKSYFLRNSVILVTPLQSSSRINF